MPLVDSRLTNEAESEFLTTEDELDYIIGDLFGTITEAAFEQSAAWDAQAAQTLGSAAEWAQDATWDALANQTLPSTATWDQAATWDAEATHTETAAPTFTGDWTQAADWEAIAATDVATPPDLQAASGPSRVIRSSRIAGSFVQSAGWTARIHINDDDLVLALA